MIRFSEKPVTPGLFILRAVVGFLLVVQWFPVLIAGPETWSGVGRIMSSVGIGFWPAIWGFSIAFFQFFGGICLVLGLFTRIFCLILLVMAGIFLTGHIRSGAAVLTADRLLQHMGIFLGLLLAGPGKWSLDRSLFPGR